MGKTTMKRMAQRLQFEKQDEREKQDMQNLWQADEPPEQPEESAQWPGDEEAPEADAGPDDAAVLDGLDHAGDVGDGFASCSSAPERSSQDGREDE